MKRVLFLIQDLRGGGAEKVLVNLVNHLDREKYDITVLTIFDGGENEASLAPWIHRASLFHKSFPGNSKVLSLFTPEQLHRRFVRQRYDIEIAYLEGAAHRIISGCTTPGTTLFAWQHSRPQTESGAFIGFRSWKESERYYQRFFQIVCVSESVRQRFSDFHPKLKNLTVAYNTNESEKIQQLACEPIENELFIPNIFKIIGVGKVTKLKGFDRLARIHRRLREEGYPVHTFILGSGEAQNEIQRYVNDNGLSDTFTFLGYQQNPYKYVAKCDLFVCSSHTEGFSTAATEALIVGTPVCTVDVSGMKEMLGEHNEFGIVTENNDEALYQGIRSLLVNRDKFLYYREKAIERGKTFFTEKTVAAVEKLFEELTTNENK